MLVSVPMAACLIGATSALANQSSPKVSLEFLEYLGGLVEQDGEWVDPLLFADGPEEFAAQPAGSSVTGSDGESVPDAPASSEEVAQ